MHFSVSHSQQCQRKSPQVAVCISDHVTFESHSVDVSRKSLVSGGTETKILWICVNSLRIIAKLAMVQVRALNYLLCLIDTVGWSTGISSDLQIPALQLSLQVIFWGLDL